MHQKNCETCKHSRADVFMTLFLSADHRIHCQKYHVVDYVLASKHLTCSQIDLIRNVGCASWESNTSA